MQQDIHVSPETIAERDLRLNAAIDMAMSIAIRAREGGILVTRHAPAHFTIAITPDVPYGQVREADGTTVLEQGGEEGGNCESEGGRWDGLWEPAARHYRDMPLQDSRQL